VADAQVPMRDVTEADIARMTAEQYEVSLRRGRLWLPRARWD